MTAQPQENRRYVVIVAFRKDPSGRGSTVGYFKTLADVPPEFKHPQEKDITDVMESLRLTDLDQCLSIMNSHWKKR